MRNHKQELKLWSDAAFTDQVSWIKWYGSTLMPETWDEWKTQIGERYWITVRKEYFVNQGWRLTPNGLKVMRNLYQSWESQHTDNRIMTGRLLLGMDDVLNAPWGVQGQRIIVFDPQMHFELQMCNGSAQEWLNFRLGS